MLGGQTVAVGKADGVTNLVVNCNVKGILETMGQVHDTRPPKPAEIKSEFVWITPEKAQECLASNSVDQRAISQASVIRHISDMKNGLWESESHQGLAFSSEGHLVDGQHRLTAIVRAGVSLWMRVDRYTGPAPMTAFDTGRKRTPGDALVVSGLADRTSGKAVAACATALKMGVDVSSTRPSSAIVSQVYEAHKDAIDHVTRALPVAISSIQAALAYLYPAAPEEVDAIIRKIRTNAGMLEDTGEQQLSLLLRTKGSRSQSEYAAAFYKTLSACEASFKKREIRTLRAPNEDTLRRHELPGSLLWANKMRATRDLKIGSGA